MLLNGLYRLSRFLIFACLAVCVTSPVVYASQTGVSGDHEIDWMNIVPIFFIFLIIAALIGLYFHVRKERENHVQVMIWMYSSILDGKLRNLIVMLEDDIVLVHSVQDDTMLADVSDRLQKDVQKGSQKDWQRELCHLDIKALRADFLDLADKSGLGGFPVRGLHYGFDCLEEASAYMKTLSAHPDKKPNTLQPSEKERLQNMLKEASDAFDGVKRKVYP